MKNLDREKAKLDRMVEQFGLGDSEVQKQSQKVDMLLNQYKRREGEEIRINEKGKVLSLAIF